MTDEEQERMNRICIKIKDEKDPALFEKLVRELLELLESKRERIHFSLLP